MSKRNYVKEWEKSLEGATEMPPCPKCGGKMVDDSMFLICGAKCTVCDFSDYEAPVDSD